MPSSGVPYLKLIEGSAPHSRRLIAGVWVTAAVGLLAFDYLTGPQILFPISFIIPVALATWWHGFRVGGPLALVLAVVRFGFHFVWPSDSTDLLFAGINCCVRMAVLVFIAVLVDLIRRQQAELRREITALKGILPICMHCKRIRNEAGEYESLESFIQDRSDAKFSHGLCVKCAAEYYSEVMKMP